MLSARHRAVRPPLPRPRFRIRLPHAHHQLQRQRHAFGGQQGLLRLVPPAQDADILCVQETKAQEHQLRLPGCSADGYHAHFRDASTKKGYSGVAIYSRREPDEVRTALGWNEFDEEGRYIEARFGNLRVVSFYVPSGIVRRSAPGLQVRGDGLARAAPATNGWPAGATTSLCGDWNIVRAQHDITTGRRQPEEFRLPAARARLAQRADRRHPRRRLAVRRRPRLARRLPRAQARWIRRIHLVEQSRRRPGPTTSAGASTTSS